MSEDAMRMEKKKRSENSVARNENRSSGWENHTGIPTQLKDRIEQSTGLSLHDVRVHYNSDLPMKLDALAYTRGNQVEIGPGQERHLPHELGHVVQQKLGMVRANAMYSGGVALNTDPGLEHQADEIGAGNHVAIVQRMGDNVVQRCENGTDVASSRVLRENLINNEEEVPDYSNAAHHIVAGNARQAAPAREVLSHFRVGINSAANGVFLPTTRGVSDAAYHPSVHTNEYYREVNNRLQGAGSREEVEEILEDIGTQLRNGTFMGT